MSKSKTVGAFVAGAVCTGALVFAIAAGPEDNNQAMEGMSPEAMAEMEAWMKAGTPGEHHEWLAKAVGEWTVAGWFKMNPSEAPTEFTGEMVTKPVFEGRYVEHHMTFDMMGMPMHGRACIGYDNIQGKFVSTWIDSMSTGIFFSEGFMSSDGALIQKGKKIMPDGTEVATKMVTNWADDNTIIDEFYDDVDGDWTLHGKMTYTRKGHAHADG